MTALYVLAVASAVVLGHRLVIEHRRTRGTLAAVPGLPGLVEQLRRSGTSSTPPAAGPRAHIDWALVPVALIAGGWLGIALGVGW